MRRRGSVAVAVRRGRCGGLAACASLLALCAVARGASAQEARPPLPSQAPNPSTPTLERAHELPGVSVEGRRERRPRTRAGAQPRRRCNGETITAISVRPRPPFLDGILDRWQFVSRAVRDLHVTTDTNVVRRFLLLKAGESCEEFRRAESERILRAQPFLADAEVRPVPDGPGRVRLEVETIDELTVLAGVGAASRSPQLRMLRAGEDNLLGKAVHASAEWRAGVFGRDGYTARLLDYQFVGRPYQAEAEAHRDELGSRWLLGVRHPYYTDLQRVAWRASAGASNEYLWLRQRDAAEVLVNTERRFSELGGIVRVGVPGRLSLFGLAVTSEREMVGSGVMRMTPQGPLAVADSFAVLGRYAPSRNVRLNALWGVRSIAFMPVVAFDALTAVQDVRVGLQAGTTLGRSMSVFGSQDDDIFVSGDLYVGAGSPTSFLMLQASAEGRQDFDSDRWDGVIGSARAAWYLHLAPRQLLLTTAEWSGGFRPRVPFQLLLGDRVGGVRGYGRSPVSGGQRAVVRAESRWHLGRIRESANYGLAGFVDAGRLWAGSVPFGEDAAARVGVGVGLLAEVPPGSQRLWRLDVAYPVSPDPRARIEVRLTSSNLSLFGWREPWDVARSRERSAPQGIFNWPAERR